MEIEEIIRLLPLLLGGKASKEQEKEVSRWLEEDEGNPVLYKELCATYYKLHYACRWTDLLIRFLRRRIRRTKPTPVN